ncbi:BamA/TamA family outer membrane protein [Sphingobacterium sp. SYP-B4668]|uniref:BamA/TamA family outer membrane protein n=1 Tax=Sphingobacterium sp. SYP-B4668 TaxID=2996035 RepID=UPI0022DDB8F4|nr:BamA/TamA family outer membrane protein [Sphingobacterium sp. SYP-B4668]
MCTCIDGIAQRPANEIEITKHLADTSRQTDLIDLGKELFKIKPIQDVDSTGQKVYFSFLPFSTNVPGGGHALITSTTAGFYLGDRKDTYMSRVTFTPYTNFSKRFGLPIRSYIWLDENKWVIDGDIRLLRFPHETWGIGWQHDHNEQLRLDYTYFRLYQHVLKRVKGGFFLGGGYNLDYRMDIHSQDETALEEYTGYPYGTKRRGNVMSSGLSLNMIYDTRANSINPWDGNYANLQLRMNPRFMGSDESWQSLFFEARRYHRFTDNPNKQHMLAIRNFFWTVFNSKAPYLDLPNLGWDTYNSSGRGFPTSRFRGKSLYYLETEYRRDITRDGLLGFVAFTNFTTVSGPRSSLFWNWNIGAGAGARIKFNKNSSTNIAIDYGFSKYHRGINLSLGEVF